MIELPDFEKLQVLIDRIQKLSLEKSLTEIKIKSMEAEITKTATSTETFFVNGKPPSMEYIKSVYLYTGFDNELVEQRKLLAEIYAELEYARLSLELLKDMIDVWRSEQANQRIAVP